jgi:6-phosphogluconate dehydrogenase
MMLVKAGSAVQDMIDKLVPLLDKGDIIIDGGNSEYHDSNVRNKSKRHLSKKDGFLQRRAQELAANGIHFVGCGVSGGEEGARYGVIWHFHLNLI